MGIFQIVGVKAEKEGAKEIGAAFKLATRDCKCPKPECKACQGVSSMRRLVKQYNLTFTEAPPERKEKSYERETRFKQMRDACRDARMKKKIKDFIQKLINEARDGAREDVLAVSHEVHPHHARGGAHAEFAKELTMEFFAANLANLGVHRAPQGLGTTAGSRVHGRGMATGTSIGSLGRGPAPMYMLIMCVLCRSCFGAANAP